MHVRDVQQPFFVGGATSLNLRTTVAGCRKGAEYPHHSNKQTSAGHVSPTHRYESCTPPVQTNTPYKPCCSTHHHKAKQSSYIQQGLERRMLKGIQSTAAASVGNKLTRTGQHDGQHSATHRKHNAYQAHMHTSRVPNHTVQ